MANKASKIANVAGAQQRYQPMAKSSLDGLVSTYVRAWNTAADGARYSLLQRCLSELVVLHASNASGTGIGFVNAYIGSFQSKNPDTRVAIAAAVDVHPTANWLRYAWDVKTSAGEVTMRGFDVIRFDRTPLLLEIVTFAEPR